MDLRKKTNIHIHKHININTKNCFRRIPSIFVVLGSSLPILMVGLEPNIHSKGCFSWSR